MERFCSRPKHWNTFTGSQEVAVNNPSKVGLGALVSFCQHQGWKSILVKEGNKPVLRPSTGKCSWESAGSARPQTPLRAKGYWHQKEPRRKECSRPCGCGVPVGTQAWEKCCMFWRMRSDVFEGTCRGRLARLIIAHLLREEPPRRRGRTARKENVRTWPEVKV